MTKFWLVVLAAALLPASAIAQQVKITWVPFVDPTENAFTVEVPQGWAVKGGVKRVSPLVVTEWVFASSPDGSMQVFFGDPDVPGFRLPQQSQTEGMQARMVSDQLPPGIVLRYRPGAEFAKFYAPNHLAAAGCGGAALTGAQAMPDLARMQYARSEEVVRGMVAGYVPPQQDAGLATFQCTFNGRTMVAGVVASTSQPIAAGTWWANLIAGYLAAPNQQAWALPIVIHLLASRRWNPHWDDAMRDATQQALTRDKQEAGRVQVMMEQRSEDFMRTMQVTMDQAQRARDINHERFMDMMDEQSIRNNERFIQDQARKDLYSWRVQAYARDGVLARDYDTGRLYEVNPYGSFWRQ